MKTAPIHMMLACSFDDPTLPTFDFLPSDWLLPEIEGLGPPRSRNNPSVMIPLVVATTAPLRSYTVPGAPELRMGNHDPDRNEQKDANSVVTRLCCSW